jgi:hypothetical protein
VLSNTIKVVGKEQREARLLLTAREGAGDLVTEMLVSASSAGGENRLIRLMNSDGITDLDHSALDLATMR